MIRNFKELYDELKGKNIRKRMIAAWAVDEHTVEAAAMAAEMGFVDPLLIGDRNSIEKICACNNIDTGKFEIIDEPSESGSIEKAVGMVHDGKGDFLMKGLCSTDKFLHAVLDKEKGLLLPKSLLLHVGVMETPKYGKLLFMGDMAVIPLPDLKQKQIITGYVVKVARSFGIQVPKVAFIAATEQVLPSMPASMEGAALAKMAERGQIGNCIADGPLALDVALNKESARIKHLESPVAGEADCLIFPNIESSNVFWKTNSKLADGVKLAGMLVGTKVPCVLASRADSFETKLNSIAEAVMFIK
ncbi:MAG: phosphate butyryltransferase [Bacteroidales bacterium]|jgi:phosphate butyryltransferase|nr:phosphate butyryltransferase [Bacteroidales bacterium]MCI1786251.1 phosphate butyryltransferase [Bacteroidales bacterium]